MDKRISIVLAMFTIAGAAYAQASSATKEATPPAVTTKVAKDGSIDQSAKLTPDQYKTVEPTLRKLQSDKKATVKQKKAKDGTVAVNVHLNPEQARALQKEAKRETGQVAAMGDGCCCRCNSDGSQYHDSNSEPPLCLGTVPWCIIWKCLGGACTVYGGQCR